MADRYVVETIKIKVAEAGGKRPRAKDPAAVARFLRTVFADLDQDQEHFVVVALNQRIEVTGYKVCHSGGMASSLVDPKIIFRNALLLGAAAIIVAHNHPSGNPEPSPEDISVTRRLKDAGDILGVRVLDHIIVMQGSVDFVSLHERGIL